MTKAQVLNDSLEFYWEDPEGRRATRNAGDFSGGCQYITNDGRKCAVGRLLDDELCELIEDTAELKSIANIIACDSFHLPQEVTSLNVDFLTTLQYWHDSKLSFKDKVIAIHNVSEILDCFQENELPVEGFFIGTFEN
jgi:hypothetical protein